MSPSQTALTLWREIPFETNDGVVTKAQNIIFAAEIHWLFYSYYLHVPSYIVDHKTHLNEYICTRWPVKLVCSSVECFEMLQTKYWAGLWTAVSGTLPTTVWTSADHTQTQTWISGTLSTTVRTSPDHTQTQRHGLVVQRHGLEVHCQRPCEQVLTTHRHRDMD